MDLSSETVSKAPRPSRLRGQSFGLSFRFDLVVEVLVSFNTSVCCRSEEPHPTIGHFGLVTREHKEDGVDCRLPMGGDAPVSLVDDIRNWQSPEK